MGFVIITPGDGDGEPNTGPAAAYVETPESAMTVVDATSMKIARVAALLDSVNIASAFENVLTIVIEDTAALAAGDTIELSSQLLVELLDVVDVYALIKTPSDIAQGWVMNTEGTQPISEYDNFEFNSVTTFKKEFYGTSDAGLYVLNADDDAGTNITSELSSLMLDMGTSRMKRIRSAYLGYTAENDLVLKVRSVSDGQLSEHWYKGCEVVSDAPREGLVQVGQGLKSRYWQFELTNVDGGDFEIDQLELHPLFLGRRV